MTTAAHPVREAIAHLDDLDLAELTPADLDRLHEAALSLAQAVEYEWARRDV